MHCLLDRVLFITDVIPRRYKVRHRHVVPGYWYNLKTRTLHCYHENKWKASFYDSRFKASNRRELQRVHQIMGYE